MGGPAGPAFFGRWVRPRLWSGLRSWPGPVAPRSDGRRPGPRAGAAAAAWRSGAAGASRAGAAPPGAHQRARARRRRRLRAADRPRCSEPGPQVRCCASGCKRLLTPLRSPAGAPISSRVTCAVCVGTPGRGGSSVGLVADALRRAGPSSTCFLLKTLRMYGLGRAAADARRHAGLRESGSIVWWVDASTACGAARPSQATTAIPTP